MFGQLLFVRLRSAENALRDGMLDEAYRLATAPDLREHRRAAAVLASLSEQFIERARSHFRADRFTEALMDLDRAEAGGILKEQIADLRSHVQTVMEAEHRRASTSRKRLEEARRRIEGGSLAAGRNILERASEGDQTADALRRAVDQRVSDTRIMLDQAQRLMAQGQLAAAAGRVKRARTLDPHNDAVSKAETELCRLVLDLARSALVDGRLSRCVNELGCLGNLGAALPAKRELSDALALAREAGGCLKSNQFADARRHVMSLSRLVPSAAWVQKVMKQLLELEELRTALTAGPLGEKLGGRTSSDVTFEQVGHTTAVRRADGPTEAPHLLGSPGDTVVLQRPVLVDGGRQERLLLLVDGGGSYLLLSGARASIGRAASDHQADVAIFSDLAERHAEIVRVDEDYFLLSARDVEVAGKPTRHQLLHDGVRIVLGRRGKLTFRLPSRRSTTAILDLSDTTKMSNDVRRVLLFHQHAMIGNGPEAHICCRHAGAPLVLFERAGSLWVRAKNDGHVDTEAQQLRLGKPMEIGGVSMVLETWRTAAPGRSRV